MNSPLERLWQEFVYVWLERFALALLAVVFWNWVLNNGLHMDVHYRIATALVLIGVSYGIGHAVYVGTRKPEALKSIPTATAPAPATAQPKTACDSGSTGTATASGTGNVAVSGDCNNVNSPKK